MSFPWKHYTARTFVDRLLRWQTVVFVLWTIVVISSLSIYVTRFSIDNSVAVWFDSGDTERQHLELFNDVFGETEWTYLWLETDSIYDAEFLRDLSALTNRLESIEHIKRVISLTNVKDNELDEEGTLYYSPIYPTQVGLVPNDEEVELLRLRLHQNPVFHNNIFRIGDDQHTIIAIQNDNRLSDPRPYRMNLIDAVDDLAEAYPRVTDFGVAGTTTINAELNRAARRDMFLFYALISILLVGSGYAMLPTKYDLIPFLVVIVGTVLPTIAVISALDLPFNMVTIMLPTVVVSMGTSYIIHFINDFHVNLRHSEAHSALAETIATLWRPGFWTATTTIIAFASLGISTVMPVRQFGLLAAFGNFLAWILTMFLAPILLHRLWSHRNPSQAPARRWRHQFMLRILDTTNHRRIYAILAIFLLGFCLTGLLQLEADTDYVHFFRESSRTPTDYQKFEDSEFPQSYVNVMIEFPDQDSYANSDNFKTLLLFEDRVSAMPEVLKVNSVTNLLREVDKAFNGSETSEQIFRAYGSSQVSQLLLLAEASGNDDVPDLISGSNQYVQLVVLTDYMSTKAINEFRHQLETIRENTLPPDLTVNITGTNVLWANMDHQVVYTQVFSVLATSIILLILLPFILGSVVLGLLGFAVSFLPILITLGLMAWFGVTVNIATCLLGGAVIGVAVDDSIYLLSRIRDELSNGLPLEASLKKSLDVTGQGIISTSLILVGGFFTMAVSDFLPSAFFGVFFAIGICSALLADLLLLPIMLKWLHERKVLVG